MAASRMEIKKAMDLLINHHDIPPITKILRHSIFRESQSSYSGNTLDELTQSGKDSNEPRLPVSHALSLLPDNIEKSNILRFNHRNAFLLPKDILNISRSTSNSYEINPQIMDIIKGRHTNNLVANGYYYLFFKTFEEAAVFWQNDQNNRMSFNSQFVSLQFADFKKDCRFMYHPYLPDLRITSLAPSKKPVANLYNKRIRTDENWSSLIPLVESIWKDHHVEGQETNESMETIENLIIDRSQCVILRNIPFFINQKKIKNLLWEFDLHEREDLNLRLVLNDTFKRVNTYVAIFSDSSEAERCVRKVNGQRLFFKEYLPVVKADLLDERI
ncbi:hypothetical protein CANARDRAFT_19515 [[Candida] arabinofermentans NRRL YB-2248]|uniref:Uncharacterized protein n=1 Tax=[Candida] arabinofermentans NRRL YB-2248 TaxID=983967 RepID=A0A1E4SVB8_9ASCO|nr:hypothetical protein CANARDRAFT_19515 [[Candida] arabinofermentans NRRL YB-2248]